MRKLRVSEKIFIAAAVIAGGLYAGRTLLPNVLLGSTNFAPIPPGKVNLVGIDPGAGYQIITANDVAQLVEVQGGFQGDSGGGSEGPTEGSIKKRVPMKELLGVLRGDEKALGPFVMIMNNIRENDDWAPHRVLWKAVDIEKALAGDPKKRAELERDLSVRLDGTPITPLRLNSLEDGIFVLAPVELTVNINGKPTLLHGETMEPYKPSFIRAVEARYKDKAVDNQMIAGYYADEAQRLLDDPKKKENVADALKHMISKEVMEQRLRTPRKLLKSATVVVNDSLIEDASFKSQKTEEGKTLSDLSVHLNDEGRRRLWKYSKDHLGNQILLIENDVAIAAPRIDHELALSNFTVTQMRDELLVRETVDTIKAAKSAPR